MLAGGTNYDPQSEEAAMMLIRRPERYFCYGGTDERARFLLIKFGQRIFKDTFLGGSSFASQLIIHRCPRSLREVLSWTRRDELIKEKRWCLSYAIENNRRDCAVLLVDAGISFYPVLAAIPPFRLVTGEKKLLMFMMRRVHCQQTVRALLAVKKTGLLRNQDRFVIQKIALVMWTTRWKWDWNKGGVLRPNPQDRFFEQPFH